MSKKFKFQDMTLCLEQAKISWFYSISGNDNDENYIKFYQLLLNYQEAFIFKNLLSLKAIKKEINKLPINKRFLNVINHFDNANKSYLESNQQFKIKTTMTSIMKNHNYNMYEGIKNKKHATNREILITRLFEYESQFINNHVMEESETEYEILTMSTDTKYHNFLRDFKKSNEIDYTPKEKILVSIENNINYQIIAEKLVSGLLIAKNELKKVVEQGFLYNNFHLIELINNQTYEDKENLITNCKLWIYLLENDLLFSSEEDYYMPSDYHFNRNDWVETKVHYLESELHFHTNFLSLMSKFFLEELIKNWKFKEFPLLKELITKLISSKLVLIE